MHDTCVRCGLPLEHHLGCRPVVFASWPPVASWCSWHDLTHLEADCPACRQGLPPVDAD